MGTAANNIQRQNRSDIENELWHLDRDASGMSSACQTIRDLPSLTNALFPAPGRVTHLVVIQFIAGLTHFGQSKPQICYGNRLFLLENLVLPGKCLDAEPYLCEAWQSQKKSVSVGRDHF
jgi:hypothetical protein